MNVDELTMTRRHAESRQSKIDFAPARLPVRDITSAFENSAPYWRANMLGIFRYAFELIHSVKARQLACVALMSARSSVAERAITGESFRS